MKYCIKCGAPLSDNGVYCHNCGQQNQYAPKKKRSPWLTALLWIFFWPVMIVMTIMNSTKIAKPIKTILVSIFCLFIIGSALFSMDDTSNSTPTDNFASTSSDVATSSKELQDSHSFSQIISDDSLYADFLDVCQEIGMDPDQIKNFEQVDDWVGGPRYSFAYQGLPLRLYCNMDSTVNAVKLGSDTDIYKQGFESYQVSDYIVDLNITAELQIMSEEYVKEQLNYPSTSNFSWLDWAFGRDHDCYSVSSTVSAKNGFGVEEELPFTLRYQVNEDDINLLYFELDGNVLLDKMDTLSIPERQEILSSTDAETTSSNITLVAGELGEYGKEIDIDGTPSINYYVPEGTYTISNNGKWCKVYLAKDDYYVNNDGYMENEIVKTLEFSDNGESQTITVSSGEHLELTVSASVSLTPVQ